MFFVFEYFCNLLERVLGVLSVTNSDKSARSGSGLEAAVRTVVISRSFAQEAVCRQGNVRLGNVERKFGKKSSQDARHQLSLASCLWDGKVRLL